jgi:hypothetical protein
MSLGGLRLGHNSLRFFSTKDRWHTINLGLPRIYAEVIEVGVPEKPRVVKKKMAMIKAEKIGLAAREGKGGPVQPSANTPADSRTNEDYSSEVAGGVNTR